jgi:hypothetical protein
MDEETELNTLVDLVKDHGQPISSPKLGKLFTQKTGITYKDAGIYRRCQKAIGKGKPLIQVQDNGQPRWDYAGRNGVAEERAARPVSNGNGQKKELTDQQKAKVQDTKAMFSRIVEALERNDISEALSYKIPADALLGQLKHLMEN